MGVSGELSFELWNFLMWTHFQKKHSVFKLEVGEREIIHSNDHLKSKRHAVDSVSVNHVQACMTAFIINKDVTFLRNI
jgi:hypothetical protein